MARALIPHITAMVNAPSPPSASVELAEDPEGVEPDAPLRDAEPEGLADPPELAAEPVGAALPDAPEAVGCPLYKAELVNVTQLLEAGILGV